MISRLPARRFREAQLLIGAALVALVAVAVAELQGVLSLARGLEDEARRATLLAAELAVAGPGRVTAPAAAQVIGGLVVGAERGGEEWGESGPLRPAWWPWTSRQEWEDAGRPVAGPLPLNGERVTVCYLPQHDGRMLRVVAAAPFAAQANRWRWLGGTLALLVAGAGGLVAWLLISRSLAPYGELLREAARVTGTPGSKAEDSFLVETFRDTVRRLEASEAALRQRAEELSLLSAGLAHEVRNALATITGYLRLIPSAEAQERGRFLAAVWEEASAVNSLLERFLTFTQPQQLRQGNVELLGLANEVVRKVKVGFPGLAFGVEGEVVHMKGDSLALLVVVENLVRNAAEALGQETGSVTVKVMRQDPQALVIVEDSGPGVSAEVAANLFTPFVSTKPSGGLGLALARRLARLHGGEVRHDAAVGRGARFVLELPIEGTT